MSKYVLDKDKTRAQALDSRRKGMEAVVTQLLKDYDMSLREFYDAYLYSIASLAVQGQELVARALVAEYEKIKTIYHSENEKFCETLLGWEGETGNKKIRRYHKDTCLAVCPYFLEDNNIRVPSIRRAVLCSFSGQLKELAYVVECPHCGITILNKDASIVKRNAEWHIRHCEFDPENKRCQTCKHFIKNLYPVRDGCALGEIIRDSDICFKHELKETKDE